MTSLVELSTNEEDRKVAEQLAGHGIGTDREILLADDAVLERTNIPQFTLDAFCQNVLYSSIRPIQGNRLLESTKEPQRLSTGFPPLDRILKGGLLPGSIIEFAGPSNTCKTIVCYPTLRHFNLSKLLSRIILSRLSSTPDIQAVYIDTLGTFNASLLRNLLPQYSTSESTVLDHIHLMRALDMVSLIEACENIKQALSKLLPIELLVIDTISNPISLLMNKGQLQGHALMQSFTNLLRIMTTRYNLATLLINAAVKSDTNTLSAFAATNVKPALGASWTFSADTCILMHRSVEEDSVTVEVIRSRTGVYNSFPSTC